MSNDTDTPKVLSDEELRKAIYPLYFAEQSLVSLWSPSERVAHEQSKLKTDQIVDLINSQKIAWADYVIGKDVVVPKRESWTTGALDKPASYHNNYEVVRYAELQNELRAEQRNRNTPLPNQLKEEN